MINFLHRNRKKQNTDDIQAHPDAEKHMGFFQHLDELRYRAVRAFVALVIGTVLAFFVAGPALDYLRTPYCQVTSAPADCELVTLGPTGGVVAYFRISLMLGAAAAIPIITYQVMMFILPGLKPKEKRYVLLSLPAITLLFFVGASFAWFVLMRPALGFLEGFQPTLFKPDWTADLYLSFVTSLVFWMGVAFETPLVLFVFSLLGLVDSKMLRRNWRIAIILSAVAAAMITPTIDPVNMFLVMGPLLALYVFSIFLVMIGKRISRAEDVN
jgi:sec-independent protein translocase protein TatC